jgi:3-oxoacyl-(acyl-carrier-protein) synthase
VRTYENVARQRKSQERRSYEHKKTIYSKVVVSATESTIISEGRLTFFGDRLKDTILSKIRRADGGGWCSSARIPTGYAGTGESCVCAIHDALDYAQINPGQIDYINAHASSTQLNDANEAFCKKKSLAIEQKN